MDSPNQAVAQQPAWHRRHLGRRRQRSVKREPRGHAAGRRRRAAPAGATAPRARCLEAVVEHAGGAQHLPKRNRGACAERVCKAQRFVQGEVYGLRHPIVDRNVVRVEVHAVEMVESRIQAPLDV